MVLVRPPRSLVLTAAAVAVAAEIALGALAQLPGWLIYPMALASGAAAIWMALALDMLARRNQRPDRQDLAELRDLQTRNGARLDRHEQSLAHVEARLRLLAAEPALAAAGRDLARISARIETWETLAQDMEKWTAAVEHWSGIVADVQADIAPDPGPPSDAEVQSARALLPPTCNFSSQDLKAAIAYLVTRERIIAAHDRVEAYRQALWA